MDGSVFQGKIAQFRVIPFIQRKKIELPENILELIDLSAEKLEELATSTTPLDDYVGKDLQFHKVNVKSREELENEETSDSESESEEDEPELDLDLDELRKDISYEDEPRRSKRTRKP